MKMMLSVVALSLTIGLSAFIAPTGERSKLPKHLKDRFALVPAGDVLIENQKHQTDEFYMSKYEVSNIDYREFLAFLTRRGKTAEVDIARIHNENWQRPGTSVQPFVEQYHKHPSYDDYPVVNVSHQAAMMYCAWLENILNELAQGEFQVEIRLPTREEWIRAARPIHMTAPYAWGGTYLRNATGEYLCNFNTLGPEQIHLNPETGVYEVLHQEALPKRPLITAPCASYAENAVGLHNMNGNVAEMVAAEGTAVGGSWFSTGYDVRVESVEQYSKPSPFVGFRPLMKVTWN